MKRVYFMGDTVYILLHASSVMSLLYFKTCQYVLVFALHWSSCAFLNCDGRMCRFIYTKVHWVTMFSTTPSFRSSHICNIYSILSTRMQWHSKMITFSKHQLVICPGHPYEIVYCFVLLTSYKIVLYRRILNSDRPISCVYVCPSVTQRCTDWFTRLWPVTGPHDFSHKRKQLPIHIPASRDRTLSARVWYRMHSACQRKYMT
jgi:hypothetical protein